jgi:hypothetical protein
MKETEDFVILNSIAGLVQLICGYLMVVSFNLVGENQVWLTHKLNP